MYKICLTPAFFPGQIFFQLFCPASFKSRPPKWTLQTETHKVTTSTVALKSLRNFTNFSLKIVKQQTPFRMRLQSGLIGIRFLIGCIHVLLLYLRYWWTRVVTDWKQMSSIESVRHLGCKNLMCDTGLGKTRKLLDYNWSRLPWLFEAPAENIRSYLAI